MAMRLAAAASTGYRGCPTGCPRRGDLHQQVHDRARAAVVDVADDAGGSRSAGAGGGSARRGDDERRRCRWRRSCRSGSGNTHADQLSCGVVVVPRWFRPGGSAGSSAPSSLPGVAAVEQAGTPRRDGRSSRPEPLLLVLDRLQRQRNLYKFRVIDQQSRGCAVRRTACCRTSPRSAARSRRHRCGSRG